MLSAKRFLPLLRVFFLVDGPKRHRRTSHANRLEEPWFLGELRPRGRIEFGPIRRTKHALWNGPNTDVGAYGC